MRQICVQLSHREGRKSRLTIEEGRPAAPAVKLGGALVECSSASSTSVDAIGLVFIIYSRVGTFCALFTENFELEDNR